MHSKFRLYRLVLKLYPRTFRNDYEDAMLQTLSDMLEDQPDKMSHALIWFRVGTELPLSITQEIISNMGEHTMDKLSVANHKRFLCLSY